jgi:competence protein ComEA
VDPARHGTADPATDLGAEAGPNPTASAAAPRKRARRDPSLRALLLIAALLTLLVVGRLVQRTWLAPAPADRPALVIPINRADVATLQLLPQVGPALAERIVAERQRRPFRDAADLQRVSGIGATIAERISPYVRFDP